jgi:hypothetical protein
VYNTIASRKPEGVHTTLSGVSVLLSKSHISAKTRNMTQYYTKRQIELTLIPPSGLQQKQSLETAR